MGPKIYITLAIVLILIIGAVVLARRPKMYTKISHQEAKTMQDQGTLVIDVREPHEYAEGHIEGAINVPLAGVENLIGKIAPDKDTPLLVHCRSGMRSRTAANKLTTMGYTKVYDFGGIMDWPFGVVQD